MNHKTVARLSLLLALSLPAMTLAEEIEIDVLGLFKDAAILRINGRQQLLKVGDRTVEGILLISADSKDAKVEINGEVLLLDLSSQIAARFEPPTNPVVSIAADQLGQYRTHGSINDRSASFLIDTGANIVALNMVHAEALGLDYTTGIRAQATTAGGLVDTWAITLDTVQIGDIKVSNVQAAVLEGEFPQEILLGMSFLSGVEMKEQGGVLVLTSKL